MKMECCRLVTSKIKYISNAALNFPVLKQNAQHNANTMQTYVAHPFIGYAASTLSHNRL